jgi:hypothetical protein
VGPGARVRNRRRGWSGALSDHRIAAGRRGALALAALLGLAASAAASDFAATVRVEADTPRVRVGRGWTLGAMAAATWQPLFTFPDYENGLDLSGGFRVARPLGPELTLALVGRTGATYVDNWRPLFEGGAELIWRPQDVELRAGVRHDDRLRREGALADFRDPTGRIFLGASVFPVRRGRLAAGAALDYERALPGANRLPSGVSVTALGRVRWPR